MLASGRAIGLIAALAGAGVAPAQTEPSRPPPAAPISDDADAGDATVSPVTVTAHRPPPPGAVVGDIKPELQLGPADIQSYGVSTVTELLDELAPQTRSERGRGASSPVVLLNGRRISALNEIRDIPTEAILRVDVLPEEVSLKYGYSADQRVVNIVLRRRFRAITSEFQGGGPTEGGQATGRGEGDLLHLRGDARLNLDLKYQGASSLTEAARGVVEPAAVAASGVYNLPAPANLADARTLAPATQSVTANAVFARPIAGGVNATVNATLGATSSVARLGLPMFQFDVPTLNADAPSAASQTVIGRFDTPLGQTSDGWSAHLSSTLNRDAGKWRFSLTDTYDHADTQTDTVTGFSTAALQALLSAGLPNFNPFVGLPAGVYPALPQATARTISNSSNVQFLANGSSLELPAGALYVSDEIGDTQSAVDSTSRRSNAFNATELARNDLHGQLNVDLPIASRTRRVYGGLGDVTLNINAAADQISGYGLLKTFGYGLNWTPILGYNLIVSHTNDQAAPTLQQLAGAEVVTPGVRVFDFAAGRSVDVTTISGGNPSLAADNRNVLKIGLTLKPISTQNLTVTANYTKSRIDHAIESFPAADAAIEAAFPMRFVRDAAGDLTQEDLRPVDFTRADRAEVRWGFDYSRPVGPQPPPRPARGPGEGSGKRDAQPRGERERGGGDGPPGGLRGGGPGGGFGGGGGPGGGGRLQVAIYHTHYLVDRLLVRPGGPTLDLLDGAAASNTGGQYRDEIEAQAGLTINGFGARLSADWRSATLVRGGPASATGDLHFSDLTTLNLRLFNNFAAQRSVVKRFAWLRGARLTLGFINLFDQRVTVRDAAGVTPVSYQAGYVDPVGRTVTLGVRKLFF